MPSYPPIVYYRDTFGLDDRRSDSDNDSVTTRSTVRTTFNVLPSQQNTTNNNNMMEMSKITNYSNISNTYHVEQLVTSKILTPNPHTLLILTLIAFASAVQLLIFSTIAMFYEGPLPITSLISAFLIVNCLIIITFTRCRPTRCWMKASLIAGALSFVESAGIFFWTALLISDEEKYIESVGAHDNRIVTSTRIAMYSFSMVFAPIHAIASALIIFVLRNQLSISEDVVNHGYFLSEPQLGHQKILVPIELRQMRETTDDETENASIGVQTGGSRGTTT
ncbi:unnamed protein product [Caenorhabditis auriculariae]|uniref:Transmembrane protein n=1 Tax=Caenorhabditis auriculariae TaxID=2777116 RepID=A0A8S1HPN6_9PELO|nr:unnamed protein product [Caenorhabditis auriculariae]